MKIIVEKIVKIKKQWNNYKKIVKIKFIIKNLGMMIMIIIMMIMMMLMLDDYYDNNDDDNDEWWWLW